MNGLSNKLDYINSRGDVLTNSITNINADIANASNRIDGMENTFNNSITNITTDLGVKYLGGTDDSYNASINIKIGGK